MTHFNLPDISAALNWWTRYQLNCSGSVHITPPPSSIRLPLCNSRVTLERGISRQIDIHPSIHPVMEKFSVSFLQSQILLLLLLTNQQTIDGSERVSKKDTSLISTREMIVMGIEIDG